MVIFPRLSPKSLRFSLHPNQLPYPLCFELFPQLFYTLSILYFSPPHPTLMSATPPRLPPSPSFRESCDTLAMFSPISLLIRRTP